MTCVNPENLWPSSVSPPHWPTFNDELAATYWPLRSLKSLGDHVSTGRWV